MSELGENSEPNGPAGERGSTFVTPEFKISQNIPDYKSVEISSAFSGLKDSAPHRALETACKADPSEKNIPDSLPNRLQPANAAEATISHTREAYSNGNEAGAEQGITPTEASKGFLARWKEQFKHSLGDVRDFAKKALIAGLSAGAGFALVGQPELAIAAPLISLVGTAAYAGLEAVAAAIKVRDDMRADKAASEAWGKYATAPKNEEIG